MSCIGTVSAPVSVYQFVRVYEGFIQSFNGTRHTIRSTSMLFAVVISPMRMAKSRTQMKVEIAVKLHHGVVQHEMITEPNCIYKVYYVPVMHLFSATGNALANSSSR